MHEKAVMEDLMRTIESRARAESALRVTRIRVRLGAAQGVVLESIDVEL